MIVGAITAMLVLSAVVLIVVLGPHNTRPYDLAIAVSPGSGTTLTTFAFTAEVSDHEDPTSAIRVRWDWDNDSVWDTPFSTDKVATHKFLVQGNYTVRMDARDTGNLTANVTRAVLVRPPPPPLRVGTVLSTSGSLSAFGASQQLATDMAVAEINAQGGALEQPVQIIHADDQTSPAEAAQAALALVQSRNVTAIVGATGSGMCASILPYAISNQVMEVAPSCTSPIFSNVSLTGGWFARTAASDALQGPVAAEYAFVNLSWRSAAVIAIDNPYGFALSSTFADVFTRLGASITVKEVVPSAQTSYAAYLQAVFSYGTPDGIFLAAYTDTGTQLLEDWWANHAAWPTHWLFSDGLYDQMFITTLASHGLNVTDFRGTSPAAYAGLEPPRYSAWAASYAARFGAAPMLFAANAYDAVYLIALAAQTAESATGAAIRSELRAVATPSGTVITPGNWSLALHEIEAGHDIDYEGASGSVNLNAMGDVPTAQIVWGVNASNRLETVDYFAEDAVVAISLDATVHVVLLAATSPVAAPAVREFCR